MFNLGPILISYFLLNLCPGRRVGIDQSNFMTSWSQISSSKFRNIIPQRLINDIISHIYDNISHIDQDIELELTFYGCQTLSI